MRELSAARLAWLRLAKMNQMRNPDKTYGQFSIPDSGGS